MRALNASGVRRLICGHTPHGDCPTVIKSGGGRRAPALLEVILADTSYSDTRAADQRGAAVGVVILYPDSTVRVLGVRQGGALASPSAWVSARRTSWWANGTRRPTAGGGGGGGGCGGRGWRRRWGVVEAGAPPRFVKAKLPDGDYLMCRVTGGFTYSYSRVAARRAGGGGMRAHRAVGPSKSVHQSRTRKRPPCCNASTCRAWARARGGAATPVLDYESRCVHRRVIESCTYTLNSSKSSRACLRARRRPALRCFECE